eukprot:scaffold260512_cov60-Attheya_sp.AAC.1
MEERNIGPFPITQMHINGTEESVVCKGITSSEDTSSKLRTLTGVKVKTGGRKYVISVIFSKRHFEKNEFEVDDGETPLFSQATWRSYLTEALKAAFSAIVACIPIG